MWDYKRGSQLPALVATVIDILKEVTRDTSTTGHFVGQPARLADIRGVVQQVVRICTKCSAL